MGACSNVAIDCSWTMVIAYTCVRSITDYLEVKLINNIMSIDHFVFIRLVCYPRARSVFLMFTSNLCKFFVLLFQVHLTNGCVGFLQYRVEYNAKCCSVACLY